MPTMKEFTIRLDDRPGTLGQLCQALADQKVNILAFQSFPLENGKSSVRFVLDNPAAVHLDPFGKEPCDQNKKYCGRRDREPR